MSYTIRFDGQYKNIPPGIQGGIKNYLQRRKRPGGFLSAVIRNDLREAFLRADNHSLRELKNIVLWFYWNAPAVSWGSSEAMEEWLANEPSD